MAMKKNNRDYIAQMNKGMKQKLSMLLIACLLFTGYHGLTISGRAEQEEKEQTNEISVSGTQVKIQLLGEDIRRAAKEAIEKGDRVEGAALQGYSGDEDLQKEYAEIFSSEKEVYEIPLDSISEGLSESLAEEEAGLQVFVERDAKDLERLVRKESKESLLLYDGNSQLSQLFPETKQEETKSAVEKKEESGAEEVHASDSNIEKTERNTELTGSELITFLYKNKADHRISFQLSVDGNTYPKVVVSPKTQLFKSFLDKLKKEEKKPQAETTVVASTEAKESTAAESTETEATASAEETEESESESAASSVSLVSTEGSSEETTVLESTVVETAEAESAEESAETKEHTTEVTEETEATEETAAERKATETVKEKKENFTGFLQEVIEHYEEFLGELQAARFAQYSLNELGRKTQNVEIKDFVTVEVFYDEDAFDEDVVLEAKRLVKPEEEGEKEGEELTKDQIKLMQDTGIYEDTDSLDIRFVSKKDKEKEVEPKENYTVTVRLTFDKKAVPEEATADTIAIHHIVEEDGKAQYVETVLRSEVDKQAEKVALGLAELSEEKEDTENVVSDEFGTEKTTFGEKEELSSEVPSEVTLSTEEEKTESKGSITKEFTVGSFSAYVVKWRENANAHRKIRIHFVDKDYREIAPSVYSENTWLGIDDPFDLVWKQKYPGIPKPIAIYDKNFYDPKDSTKGYFRKESVDEPPYIKHNLKKSFPGYKISGLFGLPSEKAGKLEARNFLQLNQLNTFRYRIDGINEVRDYDDPNAIHDFYFVYDHSGTKKCPKTIERKLSYEKYITKTGEEEYELTLTGQVKTPLDVLFVYDNTGNIPIEEEEETRQKIKDLMDKLTADGNGYDARFALISMEGESKPNITAQPSEYTAEQKKSEFYKNDVAMNGHDIAGSVGDIADGGTSPGLVIEDAQFTDVRTIGFSDKKTIKTRLDELKTHQKKGIGANYAAAIRDAKSLMNWVDKTGDPDLSKDEYGNVVGLYGNFDRQKINSDTRNEYLTYTEENVLGRPGAKAVVVFIAGSNPTKAYAKEDGKYDDYVLINGKYYLTRAEYKKGQSIGTGRDLNYSARNAALGELTYFVSLDAFYTVGVGDKKNWNQLGIFTDQKATQFLPKGVACEAFDGHDVASLENSFAELYKSISKVDKGVTGLEIEDTLSENVELIPNSVKGRLVRMKPNMVEEEEEITGKGLKDLGLMSFGAKYERGSKKITLKPNEKFILYPGYELQLKARIKISQKGKDKYSNNSGIVEGAARTDLNDIYDKAGLAKRDESIYGTSAGKPGLPTNDAAEIKGHYIRPTKCDPCKKVELGGKYPIPIVKPNGELTLVKTLKGLDGKVYDRGNFTEFGKNILKDIYFKIYEVDENDQIKGNAIAEFPLYREQNTYSEQGSGNQSTEGKFYLNRQSMEIARHRVTSNAQGDLTLSYTITKGLPGYKKYKVVEEIKNQPKQYDYQVWERGKWVTKATYYFNRKEGDEQAFKFNGDMTISYTNIYSQTKMSNISVKKIIKKGSAVINADSNKPFEFYLLMVDGFGNPVSKEKATQLAASMDPKTISAMIDGKTKEITWDRTTYSAIGFNLTDGQELKFMLPSDYSYLVLEKKTEGYGKPSVDFLPSGQQTVKVDENDLYYVAMTPSGGAFKVREGDLVQFTNVKNIPPLTGIVRDLTPYLFSLFGFTLMVGAYFVINKKKRKEI